MEQTLRNFINIVQSCTSRYTLQKKNHLNELIKFFESKIAFMELLLRCQDKSHKKRRSEDRVASEENRKK